MTGVVMVTGATGFVGRALVGLLRARGRTVRAVARRPARVADVECAVCGEIDAATDWRAHLAGVDAVAHLAGHVHATGRVAASDRAAFWRVNVDGGANLARQAAAAAVRRVVYLSTIKVHGEGTGAAPFAAADRPRPRGAYAESKHAAELAMREALDAGGAELVVVRPPLVYGAGVKGNLRALTQAVLRGAPLPFASLRNARSLVGVTNLCDFVARCLDHPAAAGRALLVADGRDLSTPELARLIAAAAGRRARLWPLPPALLRLAGALCGRRAQAERLCGDLRVDARASCELLDWRPPHPVEKDLKAMVEAHVG